ncbi:MAG TPA: M1 family metallopeptidase, partial [Caldilinea sp.]|nr:M1 family metallopeptidase [Caldilinea sp.]
VVSEPGGAMTWYPSNNHPLDKASYTMRVTVDAPNVVAANGVLVETIADSDQVTYVWEMAQPMATYLATLAIGDFVRVEGPGPDGTLIRHYFPRDMAESLTAAFANTGEMVDFYSDLIGPYPFDEYGVVVMPFPLGFALETQTLSVFGTDMTMEGVNAHELAHQWFGNDVSPAAWNETWLNEGFASYLQKLWSEEELGSELLDDGMRQYYEAMRQMEIPAPGNVAEGDMFSMAVYERGAWVLHALRLEIGDDLFRQVLRTYYDRFKGSNATTADFIAVASEVSGRDLTDFLSGWIYSAEMPAIPE